MAVAIAATTTNQRICRPAPPLVLDNAGADAVVVIVNNTGLPSSKLPMAAIVHVSAGEMEEAPVCVCFSGLRLQMGYCNA